METPHATLGAVPGRILWTAAAFLLFSVSLEAQAPSDLWRTVETRHFRIHYPAPFQAWATRAAARIEAIHQRVTDYVGYTPGRPIEVLVHDPAAAANGFAFPFLDRAVIVLWTSPPEAESAIGYYSDWTELLLTHELAHIVHLARPRNQSRGILARFSPVPIGPILRKAPRWVNGFLHPSAATPRSGSAQLPAECPSG